MVEGSFDRQFKKLVIINLLDEAKKEELQRRYDASPKAKQRTFLTLAQKMDRSYVQKANSDMELLIKKAQLLVEKIKNGQSGGGKQ